MAGIRLEDDNLDEQDEVESVETTPPEPIKEAAVTSASRPVPPQNEDADDDDLGLGEDEEDIGLSLPVTFNPVTSPQTAVKMAVKAMRDKNTLRAQETTTSNDGIELEDNIPIPETHFGRGRTKENKYAKTISRMQPTQSFFIPNATLKKCGYLRKIAARFDKYLSMRAVKGGVRVWCVERTPENDDDGLGL